MKARLSLAVLSLLLPWGLATGAWAEKDVQLVFPPPSELKQENDVGMISIPSAYSVLQTSDRLVSLLNQKKIRVFARIDHQAQAQSVKLALRPTTLLLFGNPQVGTQLMHQNQTLGLDLPLKFLIWQAPDQQVYISWNNPYYLAKRHGLPANLELLSTLSQSLYALAKTAGSGAS